MGAATISTTQAYEEGDVLDRTIYMVLMLVAIHLLAARSVKFGDLVRRNVALALFLAYALLSVMWSDFPFVSFKRWFRDLGSYLMILLVLTEPLPFQAVQTLLRRLCYLLIPLSIMLIKYYPHLGKGYDGWTGGATYLGATTSKNMLGVLCLVSGMFFFWDTLRRWSCRREHPTRRIIVVNIAFIGMTLWLLNLASSATSRVCLMMGCLIIALAQGATTPLRVARLRVLIPAALGGYVILQFGFNINDLVIQASARDTTLTGRTELWHELLSFRIDPLLGTGYESFWLGDRLYALWTRFSFRPTQAHNGYLELYLNLGVLGLCLLAGFLIASYRRICARLASPWHFASLSLGLWTVLLFYNVTEAAFKSQLLWFTFLLGSIVGPGTADEPVPGASSRARRFGWEKDVAEPPMPEEDQPDRNDAVPGSVSEKP
jgi:O-antigen ligase